MIQVTPIQNPFDILERLPLADQEQALFSLENKRSCMFASGRGGVQHLFVFRPNQPISACLVEGSDFEVKRAVQSAIDRFTPYLETI